MKSTIKLGSIELNGVKLENIEVTQEYNVTEAISMINFGKKFMTDLIEESPSIIESLERAFNKFNEVDNRVEEQEESARLDALANLDRGFSQYCTHCDELARVQAMTSSPLTLTDEATDKIRDWARDLNARINRAYCNGYITMQEAHYMRCTIEEKRGQLV